MKEEELLCYFAGGHYLTDDEFKYLSTSKNKNKKFQVFGSWYATLIFEMIMQQIKDGEIVL